MNVRCGSDVGEDLAVQGERAPRRFTEQDREPLVREVELGVREREQRSLASNPLTLLMDVDGGVEALAVAELDELEEAKVRVELIGDDSDLDAGVDRVEPSFGDLSGNRDRKLLLVQSRCFGVELGA